MKLHLEKSLTRGTVALWIALAGNSAVLGQGTITFNGPPYWAGTDYYEQGVGFHVVLPGSGAGYDDMGIAPNGVGGTYSQDGTPYMVFHQQLNPFDFVSFSPSNGSIFGLTSVQLADPNSPSLSPVAISFVGHLVGGLTVTNIFTTPGNGADHLLNYQFTSQLAWRLQAVDILAPRWAMDNLVFSIPEPSALAVVGLGGLAVAVRQLSRRRRSEGLVRANEL